MHSTQEQSMLSSVTKMQFHLNNGVRRITYNLTTIMKIKEQNVMQQLIDQLELTQQNNFVQETEDILDDAKLILQNDIDDESRRYAPSDVKNIVMNIVHKINDANS